MLELLRDQMWQSIGVFTGVLLGVIAIVVSIVIARKQDKKKHMTYQVISNASILSIQKEIEGRAEIHFDGKVVKDLRLAVLKIWNSGQQPVLPSDFIEPLSFRFGSDAEILDAETLTVEPSHLKVSLQWGLTHINILPLLLNPGDSIQLKVLVSGMERKIELECRIAGLREMTEFDEKVSKAKTYKLLRRVYYTASSAFIISGFIFFTHILSNSTNMALIAVSGTILITALITAFTTLIEVKRATPEKRE